MRRECPRGFSLLELLAATALLGLLALTTASLAGDLTRQATAAEQDQDSFERRELALMRLRSAARHATRARGEGAIVVLEAADGRTRWCVRDGIPQRLDGAEAGGDAACERAVLRVESRPRGTVLRVALTWAEETILVGGGGP